MDFQTARKVMVDSQVRVNDVTDRALQAALLAGPREGLCAPDRAFSTADLAQVPAHHLAAARQLRVDEGEVVEEVAA